ncbi:hypothetical protein E2562_027155 [Oryza meyeriana var. granulata]|uniref:Uncharacterized protein n=1 Tax=Oryza meyeriana var. granulata TaxID=110450 RepID=A0A6G1EQ22_9ORYZ|nr:hypothetical protein E2562_027155 [Oryza meyeriana var. granulata]
MRWLTSIGGSRPGRWRSMTRWLHLNRLLAEIDELRDCLDSVSQREMVMFDRRLKLKLDRLQRSAAQLDKDMAVLRVQMAG